MFRYFIETNHGEIWEVSGYRSRDGSNYESFDHYRQIKSGQKIEGNVNGWIRIHKSLQFKVVDKVNHYVEFIFVRLFWEEEWE